MQASGYLRRAPARRLAAALVLGVTVGLLPVQASSLNEEFHADSLKLANGLQVWLKPRPGSGTVSLVAGIKVGRRYETLRQRGLAHFVEHMVYEGTSRRSHEALAQDLRKRGGSMQGMAGEDVTWFGLDLPSSEMEFGLKWLAEVLFDSTFPPDRIEVTQRIILRERTPYQPGGLWWRVQQATFGDNSVVEGPEDYQREVHNLQGGLRLDDLLSFYREQYVPNNAVLAVVGDFTSTSARSGLERAFGAVPRGKTPGSGARRNVTLRGQPVRVASAGDSASAGVCCGYAEPDCSANDLTLLQWVMWLVGTRAADRIREEEGLSYQVSSTAEYQNGGTLCMLWAGCRPGDISRVERILREELSRVRSEPVPGSEIAMLKTNLETSWRGFRQDNGRLARLFAGWAAHGDPPLDLDRFLAGLTPGRLQNAARSYFRPERFFIGYQRPRRTPGERAGTALLFLALCLGLGVAARRRNSGLPPLPEDAVPILYSPMTPRSFTTAAVTGAVWMAIVVLALWPLLRLSDFLFHRAMFAADFVVFALVVAGFLSGVGIALLTSIGRRLAVTPEGILLTTWGFRIFARREKIVSIQSAPVSLLRRVFDPRQFVYGVGTGRYVVVRTTRRITIALSVPDPDGFARDAVERLGLAGAMGCGGV